MGSKQKNLTPANCIGYHTSQTEIPTMSQASSAGAGRSELLKYISRQTLDDASARREAFLAAQPFRHVSIDSFFDEGFAERLLADFPVFDRELVKNEVYGDGWGGKATNPKLRAIAPVYRELYELIESEAFLEFMSDLTGIDGLLFDPAMY